MDAAETDGQPTCDGVGDNADLDDDNDGVADVHDQLPNDPTETVDTDGDGVGDNADLDDDNDGTLDADDWAPTDPMVQNPPAPTHEDVTIVLALGSAEQAALKAQLKDHGDSETLTVPANGTATRARRGVLLHERLSLRAHAYQQRRDDRGECEHPEACGRR